MQRRLVRDVTRTFSTLCAFSFFVTTRYATSSRFFHRRRRLTFGESSSFLCLSFPCCLESLQRSTRKSLRSFCCVGVDAEIEPRHRPCRLVWARGASSGLSIRAPTSRSGLDTPGVEDWLKEFAKPPPRIQAGANGAASVKHAQNVRLSATVKQNVRRLHVMCVYFLRASHPELFLQFFSDN